jgi:hypothetical protein
VDAEVCQGVGICVRYGNLVRGPVRDDVVNVKDAPLLKLPYTCEQLGAAV